MEGRFFVYDFETKLCAFQSGPATATSCLVFVGCLWDGFLTVPYVPALGAALHDKNIALIQVLLSSSYKGFGTSSLDDDAQELSKLINYISKLSFSKIFLLGHSTGCQDIMWYLKNYYNPNVGLAAAFLQSPASDREYYLCKGSRWHSLLQKAKDLCDSGHSEDVLPLRFIGAPITAYRLCSLLSRKGDDDFFSVDISNEERKDLFFSGLEIPVYPIFGDQDECIVIDGLIDVLSKSFKSQSKSSRFYNY